MSWDAVNREIAVTGVEFGTFWYDSIAEGCAYFFSWNGLPRCTVLVVWDEHGPTHIECRKRQDELLSPSEHAAVEAEVRLLFNGAPATPSPERQ